MWAGRPWTLRICSPNSAMVFTTAPFFAKSALLTQYMPRQKRHTRSVTSCETVYGSRHSISGYLASSCSSFSGLGGFNPFQRRGMRFTPDREIQLLVIRWRERARELLAQAETMLDTDARQTMKQITAKYDFMAQGIEQRVRRVDET